MGIGTFGSFTQARLAIYAAQTGITVTGNNISNINTPGYTRQRLNQVSLYASGADRYYAAGDVRTGQGALVKSLSQIRDPYLDIRYRTLSAKTGYADGRLGVLNQIQQILDEVGAGDESKGEGGHGVLGLELEKLGEAFKNLVDQTGHQEYDNTVRQIAQNLLTKLNSYANKLEELRNNTIKELEQNVAEVNDCLTTIRSLNEEIRKSEIHGDPALELRDERNLAIDKLSDMIDIKVIYTEEEIAAGLKVEKLNIYLDNANPDGSVKTDESLLVSGVYSAQLRLDQVPVKREIDPNDPTTLPFWDDVNQKAVATEAEATTGLDGKPMANAGYLPYLTAEGKPTAVLSEAKKVNDDNYSLSITSLKDKIGEVYIAINKGTVIAIDGDKEMVDDGTGQMVSIADLLAHSGRNSFTVETLDKPAEGDKSLMIYKRTKLPNGGYAYTRQLVTQEVSKKVQLDDNDLTGRIQALREMLTEQGEFTDRDVIANIDENAGGKRGIPYYQRTLDLLANQFAKAMNEANQGFLQDEEGNYITKGVNDAGKEIGVAITIPVNGKDEKINSDWEKNSEDVQNKILAAVDLDADTMKAQRLSGENVMEAYLKGQTWQNGKFEPENKEDITLEDGTVVKGWGENAKGIFVGGVLFSNNPGNDDPSKITAANISISNTWQKNHLLVCAYKCPPGALEPASGASDNVLHFEYLVTNQKYDFVPTDLDGYENASSAPMLNGTFFEMWNNIGTTRGEDQSHMESDLNANYKNLLSVDTSRDSVSSVDFNDEAMNLMMYSKSYNAACRLMTTIDSVLDKLINGTGITT
ncbi:MAG: hypothetical protein HFF99_01420 [Oscillibacter sp.]|nr:hypothetical protein [uncultured Oscillibacter sp.]MCI8970098.1 hypothetical protein [Oscillibacter sp.]